MKEITLIKNIPLTQDVFELHYDFWEKVAMKPGQFITFILPWVWGRSYSILEVDGNTIKLTVKRRSKEDAGRGGSIMLCDSEIGTVFKAVGPAGHFVLQENDDNKLFIGTGTWVVPLYNQIISALEAGKTYQIQLIFWVRKEMDLFYIDILDALSKKYDNFSFTVCISREDVAWCQKWYVTNCLWEETVQNFQEFYICGMPDMIDSCQAKLTELWVPDEKVFFERYA